MLRHRPCLALAAALLVVASQASAQKKISVKIIHQPAFGDLLTGKRVIAGPITGDCSRELGDALTTAMRSGGVHMVPQPELDGLQITWPMSAGAASELHRRLGPSVLLTAEVTRCYGRQREQMFGPGLPASHISRVDGRFEAQLHFIDLATAREVGAYTLRAESQKQNESPTGIPEYPSQSEVAQMALAKAVAQAQRVYGMWTETRELPFMDDKECNVRQASELVKAGDYDGALRLARDSAAACTGNPKIAASAWYNLGVIAMLKQNYEEALNALEKAQSLSNRKFIVDIVAECRAEKQIADARKPSPPPEPLDKGAAVQTGIVLTKDFVIKLVQGNVAEEEIVAMIGAHAGRFVVDAESLRKLREAGTPDAVISAMSNKMSSTK